MNTLRWTIYKAADSQGTVIDKPSLDKLRELYRQGWTWVDRGFKVESMMDVIMDLDMSEDLKRDRLGGPTMRFHAIESEEELLDDFNYTDAEQERDELDIISLQRSLTKFLDKPRKK